MLLRFVAVAAMTNDRLNFSTHGLGPLAGAIFRENRKTGREAGPGEAKFEATEPGPDQGKVQNAQLKTIRSKKLRFNIFCFGFPETTIPSFAFFGRNDFQMASIQSMYVYPCLSKMKPCLSSFPTNVQLVFSRMEPRGITPQRSKSLRVASHWHSLCARWSWRMTHQLQSGQNRWCLA